MITKMSHDWEAAVVTIRYDNATLTGADEVKAFAFLRAAVDTQHAKAGGSFELRVQWILEPRPRTLRDEVIAAVESVPVSHVDRNRVANAGDFADVVLAVVKGRLDTLPTQFYAGSHAIECRDIDALFGTHGALQCALDAALDVVAADLRREFATWRAAGSTHVFIDNLDEMADRMFGGTS